MNREPMPERGDELRQWYQARYYLPAAQLERLIIPYEPLTAQPRNPTREYALDRILDAAKDGHTGCLVDALWLLLRAIQDECY